MLGPGAWNARLDPAVWLLAVSPAAVHPTLPPHPPGTRCPGELGTGRFQEEEGRKEQNEKRKDEWGGKGMGKLGVTELLGDQISVPLPLFLALPR